MSKQFLKLLCVTMSLKGEYVYHLFAPCRVTVFRLHMLDKKNIMKDKGKSKPYFIYNNKVVLIKTSGHAVLKIKYIIKLKCAFQVREIVFTGGWDDVDFLY